MFPKQKDKRELRSNGTGRIIFGVAARHRCFDKATCPKQYFDVVTRQWTTWPIEKLTSSEFSPANPCTVCLFFPFFFLPPSLSLSLCRSTRSPFFLFFSSVSFFLFFLFFFFFFFLFFSPDNVVAPGHIQLAERNSPVQPTLSSSSAHRFSPLRRIYFSITAN